MWYLTANGSLGDPVEIIVPPDEDFERVCRYARQAANDTGIPVRVLKLSEVAIYRGKGINAR